MFLGFFNNLRFSVTYSRKLSHRTLKLLLHLNSSYTTEPIILFQLIRLQIKTFRLPHIISFNLEMYVACTHIINVNLEMYVACTLSRNANSEIYG